MTTRPGPDDRQPPRTRWPAWRRRPSLRERWADRRRLRQTLGELEQRHREDMKAQLDALAAATAVVSRVTLVENRPSLRLLQIDLDGDAPSLLASVDPDTISALAALRLPALLLVQGVTLRRGAWALRLATLDQAVVISADEMVVGDGLHRTAAEGSD